MRQQGIADTHFGANLGIGVFFALVFTLIFLMIEQGINQFRHWISKPVRGEPIVPEFLEDGIPRRRVLANGRLRIGK